MKMSNLDYESDSDATSFVTVCDDYDSDFDSDSECESCVKEEAKVTTSCCECSICFDEIGAINTLVTECGHKFHASCVFKSFVNGTFGCPLCRTELAEIPKDEDEDEEDDESEYDDEDEDEDDEEAEEIDEKFMVSCEQIANKFIKMGYNMADVIALALEDSLSGQTKKDSEKYTIEFLDTLRCKFSAIIDGEIAVDYRDKRSYAEVLKSNLQLNKNNKNLINDEILTDISGLYN